MSLLCLIFLYLLDAVIERVGVVFLDDLFDEVDNVGCVLGHLE